MTYPEVCREIVAADHEAGLHGYAHENVGMLAEWQEREMFRRIYGLVEDFTPPRKVTGLRPGTLRPIR